MNVTMLRGLAAISLFAATTGVTAQDIDESALDALDKTSVAAVQPIREPAGAAELRAAMRRISYNSSDADALADAGNASLMLGDANAALNFFTRANTIRPNNGRIVAGLATATVRTENPFEALRLFDDAIRLGVSDRTIAADRALAFDLLGNFARAQQDYKLARTAVTSDDLLIRQAISLSLGGQKSEADNMLLPLLQKNGAAAWGARGVEVAWRLLLGTARYPSPQAMSDAVKAARAGIVTVSVRREQARGQTGQRFFELIKELGVRVMPNTAGCRTPKEAITTVSRNCNSAPPTVPASLTTHCIAPPA